VGVGFYWSRTAIFAFMIGIIFLYIKTRASYVVYFYLFWTSLIVISYLALSGDIFLDESSGLRRSLNTIRQILGFGGETNFGDVVRVNRIAFALDQTLTRPFGSSFELFSQELFPLPDIPIAENGYLDIGVRGGILSIIIFIYIQIMALRKLGRWSPNPVVGAIGAPTFALSFGAMLFLHVATEVYIATVYWFILGALNSLLPPDNIERINSNLASKNI